MTALMPTFFAPTSSIEHSERRPLRVALDASIGVGLRSLLLQDPAHFVVSDIGAADCVLFGTDELSYVARSLTFRLYRNKCFCISESDIPSFVMPGLYAANRRGWLTQSRAATISYCISLRFNRNDFLNRDVATRTRKTLLYSFMGGMNSWPRRRLLRHVPSRVDAHIEATDRYDHWGRDTDIFANQQQRRYSEVMSASKYVVCPRGCGISSYRLFEAMSLGIAPVIISDAWRPIDGIDWRFALFVLERDVAKLDGIIRAHEDEWRQRGDAAFHAYQAILGDDAITATLRRELDGVRRKRRGDRELIMATCAKSRITWLWTYWAGYKLIKQLLLRLYAAAGREFPYALHRPSSERERRVG